MKKIIDKTALEKWANFRSNSTIETDMCEKQCAEKEHPNVIVNMEAIEAMKLHNSESVQIIITDPPYGIAYHSNHYANKNPHSPVMRDWNFQIGPFLNEVSRVLKDGGVLYLFTRWDVYPIWASEVISPLNLKNAIVWKKDNWSAGDLKGDFGNQYELLMMIVKGVHKRRGHRWSNVWDFPRVPFNKMLHPTQKPVEIFCRAIEASSDIGDVVVDPFCGSGTAGEAAISCGRKFFIGDIDPNMVRISCKRLELAVPNGVEEVLPIQISKCPVFGIIPPDPSLWGTHPEDIAYFFNRNKE